MAAGGRSALLPAGEMDMTVELLDGVFRQQEKRDQDEHLVLEKARSVNKLNFRP